MKSFQTLDSDHKVLKGGRGVGRLLWLKAFKVVKATSFFGGEDSGLKKGLLYSTHRQEFLMK
jgi:hypothetical protein